MTDQLTRRQRDRDPAVQGARRAFREAHGHWPTHEALRTAAAPPPAPASSPFDAAYSGPEVGPIGATWPEDGRHVPYMVWQLPYNSGGERSKRPNNVTY
jgi:hypothetical protein